MDKSGMIGEILETGQTAVKKQVKQTASDLVNTAKGQVGSNPNAQTQQDDGANEVGNSQQQMNDDQAKQFLQDLYGKSDKTNGNNTGAKNPPQNPAIHQTPVQKAMGMAPADPNAGKTPEELAKIESLRKQLHGDYYQDLVNPPKSADEPVAEKIEREEQEERWELQEKEKEKPPPLAVTNAQKTERNPGASG